ncbi:putative adhesin [Chitinimonas sp. PSY-7]|uniref:putative adhesin n=1 Tax=Chitinimonas sp. PSY-7 TaxID=3459088 RepID=UPI00403FCA22
MAPPGTLVANDFDVLTIRNRFMDSNVKLSTVLQRVRSLHLYRDIHCYFCRSFTLF